MSKPGSKPGTWVSAVDNERMLPHSRVMACCQRRDARDDSMSAAVGILHAATAGTL
jgi:hypothetical protein